MDCTIEENRDATLFPLFRQPEIGLRFDFKSEPTAQIHSEVTAEDIRMQIRSKAAGNPDFFRMGIRIPKRFLYGQFSH